MKIDRRIGYKMVVDCETAPCNRDFEGVASWNMLVYDLGFAVVDKHGNVYETKSFVNADIFLGEKQLMKSAYYANKIPQYWEDIKNGSRILTSFYNIRKAMIKLIEKYEITEIYAHNMRFDYGALNNTQRWETKSKFRYFFPKDALICDTLKMARDVIGKMPTYTKFCEENGFLTKANKPQMKAETLYRFITKDVDFIESHTGLEDVLIEKEILAYCYRQHKKMRKALFE